MLFKTSPEKFWDLIASKYAASPIKDKIAYETKIQKLKSYLTPEKVVLDIGCGTGTQCSDIAGDVKHVTGIDISRKLLAIAEQRKTEQIETGRKLDNVDFIQTSLFDERFSPGSFDVVMAFYVVHFFEDIDVVFQQIFDLLKPDGLFISETVCLGDKGKFTGKLLRFAGHLGFLPKMSILTTRQLEQALDKTGFSIVDKIKFSHSADSEFTLIAKKR